MKIYLVGGAVRDKLLGRPVKERDWVVVGATGQDMLKLGYRQVGKDFPVFLDPKKHEEYALARTERKVGRGYTGFEFNTSPNVTLEEDLLRRDLTINAMAEDDNGTIIDPYQGQEDIKKQLLRHVSPAFAEDPVRILRIARFAARFNYAIAPETMTLMRSMVTSGEIDALVAERVWKELERALTEDYPNRFFEVLNECGALERLFPATIDFSMLSIAPHQTAVRFATLLHALSESDANTLSDRYRVPNDCRALAILTIKHLPTYLHADHLTAEELVHLFTAVDAYRRESRFVDFLSVCTLFGTPDKTQHLLACFNASKAINVSESSKHLAGKDIAASIKAMRIDAIQKYKNSQT